MERITAKEAREMLNEKVDYLLHKVYQGVLEQVRQGKNYYVFELVAPVQYIELATARLKEDGYEVTRESGKEAIYVICW